jgi:predicted transcriptional regulator
MYAANMSWKPVRKILDNLVDRGLLSVTINARGNTSRRHYIITDKGISVLNYLEGAQELVDIT